VGIGKKTFKRHSIEYQELLLTVKLCTCNKSFICGYKWNCFFPKK